MTALWYRNRSSKVYHTDAGHGRALCGVDIGRAAYVAIIPASGHARACRVCLRKLAAPVRQAIDVHANPDCPQCGGQPAHLGDLGAIAWYRCRQCGLDYHA